MNVQTLQGPYRKPNTHLRIQSILYLNDQVDVERSIQNIHRACELAISDGCCGRITLAYGDCSPSPVLDDKFLKEWGEKFALPLNLDYHHFGENLGSAAGHNRLAGLSQDGDFLLIENPDVVPSPRLFEALLEPFRLPNVGMVEAKQLPIEHPKDYNKATGETDWATTACAMIPRAVFDELGGFDSRSFFLYCDDVDFSWLVREAGLKVIFQPSATVFHDKRLSSQNAGWQPTNAERYYSAEASMIMAHKWSRADLVQKYLKMYQAHGDDFQRKAAEAFVKRMDENNLPEPRDPKHRIGTFTGDLYTQHRYKL
ncbi:glycosyltransferase family 2 protein [Tianweitania populi]|uniref:Glycosyl transferase n=1 Tax=Tianweitania populi TaxID=1607949 RepID=A0A8J3DSV6_9HYPH|nr:glycosyltransferase family 2 protein [Tianweitania populi]GHD21380.1 glycosyl transferase [Tianweitania populi]